MEAKPIGQSRSIQTLLVFPADTNYHGTMFGGKLMQYIDEICVIAAMRHSNSRVVTASTDSLDFMTPIRMNEAVELEAFVTWTHRTSMEVYCVVRSENLLTGERRPTVTAFCTFVAVNEEGKPTEVPPVYPETEEERKLFESAPERHVQRKLRRQQRYTEPS
ncbi:acyl-CoA thioesterase [Cohnella lubricantis]|uniref:Acyl-CoA thioesterase n=1 Tax=Cohnella lubricantis TaxID=2163172 RepID=A0A841T849_9BACL|nr:acyl-CoA thioesterase [Cohnella lubricantis]MBB6676175.1 acyl-CoA thioesterase [Cohnella lubricantis]